MWSKFVGIFNPNKRKKEKRRTYSESSVRTASAPSRSDLANSECPTQITTGFSTESVRRTKPSQEQFKSDPQPPPNETDHNGNKEISVEVESTRKERMSQRKSSREYSSRREPNSENNSAREKIGQFLSDMSQKVKRTMRIKSRPINDQEMKKFTKRVEERRQHQPPRELLKGEDAFPSKGQSVTSVEKIQPAPAKKLSTECVIKNTFPDLPKTLSSGSALITTNNNNNGKLFVNGKPFWVKASKGDEDDKTEDDLPLNADVVLDVSSGKIKLVPMPTTTVSVDPYNELHRMKAKDKLFFTKDILFGNTVRTMINTNEAGTGGTSRESCAAESTKEKTEKTEKTEKRARKERPTKTPKLIEPKKMLYYTDHKNMSKSRSENFTKTEKKKGEKSARKKMAKESKN